MFAENLLESSPSGNTNRGWTTLISFTIQSLAILALVALPILFPQALQMQVQAKRVPTFVQVVVPATDVHEASDSPASGGPTIGHTIRDLVPGGRLPESNRGREQDESELCLHNCGVIGIPGVPFGEGVGTQFVRVTPPPVVPAIPPRISVMNPGAPLVRTTPIYPALAKATGRQGEVVLVAIIGKDGSIADLRVRSGDPVLAHAAREAVKTWRYRPYILNGTPIEVETQITVTFRLER
jgi:periplasmic protein TonB